MVIMREELRRCIRKMTMHLLFGKSPQQTQKIKMDLQFGQFPQRTNIQLESWSSGGILGMMNMMSCSTSSVLLSLDSLRMGDMWL